MQPNSGVGKVYRPIEVATWNIAGEGQDRRVGQIADFLAAEMPTIAVITEITATKKLKEALTREIGPQYDLGVVATGSLYEDSIGLLVTAGPQMIDEVEAIPTGGKKMPNMLLATLTTSLGEIGIVGLRGAYFSGKGGLLTGGAAERQAQFKRAFIALNEFDDGIDIALVAGDMNSPPRSRDPMFAKFGYRCLTEPVRTWPDPIGIKNTTRDARILAMPFLLTHQGLSIDAVYGRGPVRSIITRNVATGLSDHLYLETKLRRATYQETLLLLTSHETKN